MKNPVKDLVERTGLSLKAFGTLYGVSLASLRNVIYGFVNSIPVKVKQALYKAGVETNDIDQQYQEWLYHSALKEAKEKLKRIQAYKSW